MGSGVIFLLYSYTIAEYPMRLRAWDDTKLWHPQMLEACNVSARHVTQHYSSLTGRYPLWSKMTFFAAPILSSVMTPIIP